MDIAKMWDKFTDWVFIVGMPVVHLYQAISTDPFLTVHAEDATGLEKVADVVLVPVQYLLAGKVAKPVLIERENSPSELHYELLQRFEYNDSLFWPKTIASVAVLPLSFNLGVALKACSYLFPGAREHYRAITASQYSVRVESNIDYYRMLGLDIRNFTVAPFIQEPSHTRRPGDENYLAADKEGLQEIIRIFEENDIPCWVECGTCLGAYRYGGVIPWDNDVDLSILENDHHNALRALNALDRKKFLVHDWSARSRPDTYLRVYVKESGTTIDIYHYKIDPPTKTLSTILSLEDHIFMRESWKIRERRFTNPVPYDWIFPLRRANFDGIVVPVPNRTKEFLQSKYGENIEPAKVYNPDTGQWEKDVSHPYWQRPFAK